MTYDDIKFIVCRMNFHPKEIAQRVGQDVYNACQKYAGTKYAYKPFCVLFNDGNYGYVYSNFRENFPLFSMPYTIPTANKHLPKLKQ